MGWQDDARRTIVSERLELETFPGYWIVARKYSVRGKDEITAATRAIQKGLDKKALLSLMKKMQDREKKEITEEALLDRLTQEELSALVESNSVELYSVAIAKLRNGIYEHNFCDGESSKEVSVFAKDILEYDSIAEEILSKIEEFNRPLAEKTSTASAMSPNGSTTEANLSTEISCLTDETPQSF